MPTEPNPTANPLQTVLSYHQRTKHHFSRYAAGPGRLDWASQPDPFRCFDGCTQMPLPLLNGSSGPPYIDLYRPGAVTSRPIDLQSVAALLELALGLSAWKQAGTTRWPLRCNPSSGNLHPTEAYVVINDTPDFPGGVYHYLSREHLLEQRCRFLQVPGSEADRLMPRGAFLLGLSSVHWREAWKYGERAYRYCQHDVGHAIAAVRYAAAVLGWQAHAMDSWADADIKTLLGLDRQADFSHAEAEHPDVMLVISAAGTAPHLDGDSTALLCAAGSGQWQGHANTLSVHHLHDWPVIEEVAHACSKPRTSSTRWFPPPLPTALISTSPAPDSGTGTGSGIDTSAESAIRIIKQRRSAQQLDAATSISSATLFRILDLTLPREGVAPWDALPWAPRVHMILFVHRVDQLEPGLYLFARRTGAEATLRAQLSSEFEWMPVTESPSHLDLFRLVAADTRNAARALSCHQDIAADGTFSVAMLGEFETSLADAPWTYRRLFWEAGMLGHVLYLEAEAAGVRGTGIGCYFDDAVHDVLGLKGQALQSMYHFTLGGALEDMRLDTLPPYAHLRRN